MCEQTDNPHELRDNNYVPDYLFTGVVITDVCTADGPHLHLDGMGMGTDEGSEHDFKMLGPNEETGAFVVIENPHFRISIEKLQGEE